MAVNNLNKEIHLVVACVIRDGDKLLLCRSPKWSDKWVVPGGHVEFEEKIMETAVREGREEVGLDLLPVRIIGFGEEFNPPEFVRLGHVVYFIVLLDVGITGELKLSSEISEARWVTLEDAKRFDLSAVQRRILEKYEEFQRQN